MIENFENINSLLLKIKEDKNTKNVTEKRFPVRYIFLSDFDTLKQLVIETTKIGIQTFELAQLLPKDDGWITKQEFISKIKTLNPKQDFLLLPFSEVARFYSKSDFNNLFSQLTELENIGVSNQRIYIPLMGIRDRFDKEFFQNFNRRIEYSFTWGIYETIQRSTIILNNNLSLKIDGIQKLTGTKEWLELWKKDLSSPTLCLSKSLFYLSEYAKPDEIFDFRKIGNHKELITQIFELEIPIKYKDSDENYWKEIIKHMNTKSYSSYNNLVKDIVNTTKININNFIELWCTPNRTDFEKWLIRNYMLGFECINDYYLCRVISNFTSFDDIDLLIKLWLNIFEIRQPTNKIFEQRVSLLNQFYNLKHISLPQNIINDYELKINELSADKIRVQYLTGILDFEKELLLKIYNKNQDLSVLDKYHELQEYLIEPEFDNLKPEQQWTIQYFKEYKSSKISNKYTKEILSNINSVNKSGKSFFEWYYSFDEVSKFLNNNFDSVFWIDALGIEWLGLIEDWINERKYNLENKYIARVNLPSTTEHNKYYNATYIQDFDKFIHNNLYKYPNSIITENNKLKEILNKIALQKNKRAIIISDHGLSALVRLNESSKNFPKAEHEGRYIEKEETLISKQDENYITKDNYIIASKHISLSTKPKREVHGGCTPEEVLVPVVIFNSITNFDKQESYKAILVNKELDVKNPSIIFNISPTPKAKVYVLLEGKRIELKKDENKTYSGKLPVKKAGTLQLKLKTSSFEEKYNIVVKSGFKEDDLF